jgi:branched-subunit amino acid permease
MSVQSAIVGFGTGIALSALLLNWLSVWWITRIEKNVRNLAREIGKNCALIWEIKENGTETNNTQSN